VGESSAFDLIRLHEFRFNSLPGSRSNGLAVRLHLKAEERTKFARVYYYNMC
jgi:hypothetical protein